MSEHEQQITQVSKALQFLAERCDGARQQDTVGFNGMDSTYGKMLASFAAQGLLRPDDAARACRMLQKYRRTQLEPVGLVLPEPWDVVKERTVALALGGKTILVSFPYQVALKDSLKAHTPYRGRQWDAGTKRWLFDLRYWSLADAATFTAWAHQNDFNMPAEVEAALAALTAIDPATPVVPVDEKRINVLPDGRIEMFSPYDPALVEMIRGLPGRQWDGDHKRNLFPATSLDAVVSFAVKNGFSVPADIREAGDRAAKLRQENERLSGALEADFEVANLGGVLRPFQRAGVKYTVVNGGRVLIGDEPGLGKTCESLAVLEHLNAYPAVVVVPATLRGNWLRETHKWLPGRRAVILNGKQIPAAFLKAAYDIFIVSYEGMSKWLNVLCELGLQGIVWDEAHLMKDASRLRFKSALTLATGMGHGKDGKPVKLGAPIPVRLALTGTPVLNRGAEILTLLQLLGRLEDLGGARQVKRILDYGSATTLATLHTQLRQTCYVRRKKEEVLTELPAKQYNDVILDLDNRAEYDRADRDLINWLHSFDSEKARRAAQAEQLVRFGYLKQLAAQGKLAGVQEWVENFLDSGEKLVLFAWHQATVERLAAAFNAPMIYGQTPAADRDAIVDRFQNDENCRLVVCNILTGGLGLTLTAGSNVGLIEYPWNPAQIEQAVDRLHRIGQAKQVMVWRFIAPNSIDEEVLALIDAKRPQINALADGLVADSGESILEALVERYLQKEAA